MAGWIRWATWVAMGLLVIWLGNYCWQAVTVYQSMTAAQVAEQSKKEQAQRQQFDQQRFQPGQPGKRPEGRDRFDNSPFSQFGRAMRNPGSDAEHLVWIAAGFWLTMQLIRRFAPLMGESVRQYIRKWLQYLREHHRAVGWLALGFTAVHSIYYLAAWWFKGYEIRALILWSGIVSFVPFLLLAVWGEWLHRHGNDQKARWVHWSLAVLMVIGMVVHDFGAIGKLFIFVGVVAVLYVISGIIKSPRNEATA